MYFVFISQPPGCAHAHAWARIETQQRGFHGSRIRVAPTLTRGRGLKPHNVEHTIAVVVVAATIADVPELVAVNKL